MLLMNQFPLNFDNILNAKTKEARLNLNLRLCQESYSKDYVMDQAITEDWPPHSRSGEGLMLWLE